MDVCMTRNENVDTISWIDVSICMQKDLAVPNSPNSRPCVPLIHALGTVRQTRLTPIDFYFVESASRGVRCPACAHCIHEYKKECLRSKQGEAKFKI